MHDLETDESGNVILRPVVGWDTAQQANSAVILTVGYLALEHEKAQSAVGNSIQFRLTPLQCLDLAAALQTAAQPLL
jgi:hypothetical protein